MLIDNLATRKFMNSRTSPRYYTPAELCELLSIFRATLNRWVKSHPGRINIDTSGRGPCVRYLRSEVHAYLERIESVGAAA